MDIFSHIDAVLDGELAGLGAVAAVAQRAGQSVDELNAWCRREYGEPLAPLVQHRRLQRATDLIRNSPLRFSDIALSCGFYDHSHLCRTLARHLGCTPSRLRRQHTADLA